MDFGIWGSGFGVEIFRSGVCGQELRGLGVWDLGLPGECGSKSGDKGFRLTRSVWSGCEELHQSRFRAQKK